MKLLPLIYLLLAIHLQGQNVSDKATIALPSLLPKTSVEWVYASPQEPQGLQSRLKVLLYKGEDSRILIRSWPSGRTTYVVEIKGWRFYTDPTAPEAYKDLVIATPATASTQTIPDFPELAFIKEAAFVTDSNLNGKSMRLVTSAPPPQIYTDDYITNELKPIHDPTEKAEVEKSLHEAQLEEHKRPPGHLSQAWLDSSTGLPTQVATEGQIITYTYHSPASAPELPPFINSAIKVKTGSLPTF